jgi:hypothetical protein
VVVEVVGEGVVVVVAVDDENREEVSERYRPWCKVGEPVSVRYEYCLHMQSLRMTPRMPPTTSLAAFQ